MHPSHRTHTSYIFQRIASMLQNGLKRPAPPVYSQSSRAPAVHPSAPAAAKPFSGGVALRDDNLPRLGPAREVHKEALNHRKGLEKKCRWKHGEVEGRRRKWIFAFIIIIVRVGRGAFFKSRGINLAEWKKLSLLRRGKKESFIWDRAIVAESYGIHK